MSRQLHELQVIKDPVFNFITRFRQVSADFDEGIMHVILLSELLSLANLALYSTYVSGYGVW